MRNSDISLFYLRLTLMAQILVSIGLILFVVYYK